MSEVVSDVLEDMVRTELTHQATAPQPDPDRILHRVRITRRRTTTMTSAAVMVLVIVVGATVWTALPRPTLPSDARLGQPAALWFTDPDHGYALVAACPATCQAWLAVTTDGGRSWHGHTIPGLTNQTGVRLRGLTTATVVLDTLDGKRWYTNDSGATWTTGTTTATGQIDHIPPGAAATIDNTTGITVLTTDGRSHHLTTAPITTTGDIEFATDGSAWIRGTGRVMVSRDRGRTWQPVALPTERGTFATHDGVHLYHTDGRHIWRKTGQAEWVKLTPPPTVWGELHAQPDGGVITTREDGGQAYYAGPDDTGFQPTQQPNLARSGHTGARRIRPTGNGWEHTADGQTWTPLRF